MLKPAAVATMLGLSARAVYALHAAGRLRGYRFGMARLRRLECLKRT